MPPSFDRNRIPEAGIIPDFTLIDESKLKRTELSNGGRVWLYRYGKLPVIQVYLVVNAGAFTDPVKKAGLTNLFSEMLDEGTSERSSLEIADHFDYLGTLFNSWASMDGCGVSMLSLREHLDASLGILSDIIVNPVFPETELNRVRQKVLTGIIQEEDQPNILANKVFTKTVYGTEHPYGSPIIGTADTVNSITQPELKQKYASYFTPTNASFVVVGDIELPDITEKLESAFSGWQKSETSPPVLPGIPDRGHSAVYLVDRPGAAQSQIRVGHMGIDRGHADYFTVRVMNQILGGQFTSRINLNLREDKGYTYGASSVWEMRKQGGHFVTAGGFQGEFTDKSVVEILKELNSIRDADVSAEELESAKEGLIRSLTRQFETPSQIASQLGNLALYDLPDSYFDSYVENVRKVTAESVRQAANDHIKPSTAAVVVVGDADKLRSPLAALDIGDIIEVDHKG